MRFPRIFCLLLAIGISVAIASENVVKAQYGRGGRPSRFGGGPRFSTPPATEEKPAEKTDDKKDDKGDVKKEEEKPAEQKKDEGPQPVQRPVMPESPANPDELKQMPAADGTIQFSFKGQPWPSVLEWLADISDMSLEWEEAPAGYVDLTTRGHYTVDEVRDLLNSYLLAKGFTVMRNGELLIVVNLKKLDHSLVPRVSPSELDKRGSYEFVRSFFDLDWLVAEQAAEEVKSLLSPYGKVTALKSTNRLDVLDTAGNLRRIRDLLVEEQSHSGQQRLVEEFKLRFTRAEEVLDTLNTLLGIEPKQAAGPVDPRQLMQAMMMAQSGGGQAAMMPSGKKENSVYLAVNARENSILANAPPDKMGVIRQAITAVDVPHGSKGFLADAQRVKVYRLSGLQPETLVKVLKELGSLDPTTKLEVDEKKNALVAYAPLADHLLITQLVERLDGTGRKFEVIQLRTLSAEYVAGSIITLMNGPEKQDDSSRRYRYYSFFDNNSQQQESTDKFWVEADIERNRLLLRANDVELAEVKALLVKLGEIPTDQRYGNQTRLIPVAPDEGIRETFDQVRSMLPNPIDIEIDSRMLRPPRRSTPGADDDPAAAGHRRARPEEAPPARGQRSGDGPQRGQRGNRSAQQPPAASRFRFAQDRVAVSADSQPEADGQPDAGIQPAEVPPEDASAAEPAAPSADGASADAAAKDAARDAEVADDAPSQADSTAANADVNQSKGAAAMPDDDGSAPATSEATEPAMNDAAESATTDPAESAAGEDEPTVDTPTVPEAADGFSPPGRRRSGSRDSEELPADPSDLPPSAHAPIHVRLSPQGLLISSSDTEALDRLEDILNHVMPPRTNYEIFTLKHTYAKDMVTLLKDIFRGDMAKESNSRTEVFDMFWNGYRGSSNQQSRATLSRRRPLNFVADPVTNTVLVQGADPSQIAEIEDLIERYDRAEPPNSESVRRTNRVALRYAKAKEVADIVKDVYRDLLSPNDKALLGSQPPQQPGRERNNDGSFFSAMFTYLTDDPTKSEVVPRFKGMLSVGVDERSNGVVVSAPQILLTEVLEMIAELDAQAKPTRAVVRVMRVRNPGTAAQVQQALRDKATQAATTTTPNSNGSNTAPAPGAFNGQSPFGGRSR